MYGNKRHVWGVGNEAPKLREEGGDSQRKEKREVGKGEGGHMGVEDEWGLDWLKGYYTSWPWLVCNFLDAHITSMTTFPYALLLLLLPFLSKCHYTLYNGISMQQTLFLRSPIFYYIKKKKERYRSLGYSNLRCI